MHKFYNKLIHSREEWLNLDLLEHYSLAEGGQSKELKRLLKSLCNSLTMKFVAVLDYEEFPDLLKGYREPKNGIPWDRRFESWKNSASPPELWLGLEEGIFYFTTDPEACHDEHNLLPVFPHYKFKSELFLQKEQSSMKLLDKNFVDRLLNQNKDAVKLSAKMSVGKAANQVLNNKLAGTFPWYAKLFGKHREAINNPFVRVGTAEAVMAAVEHFYPENEKLKYVAEAMLQEAMVDVVTNSSQFKGILNELEALAGHLPGETK